MHIVGHALSAIPFLLVGMPMAAVGALLPDVTWVSNEMRYRASFVRPWSLWIKTVPDAWIVPYRIAHSLFVPALLLSFHATRQLGYGYLVHLLLDLPTHRGVMRQQPLYPIKWRWPWTFR